MSSPKRQAGKKYAVFDIDGTIFRSSLLIELTEALILDGIFPPSVRRGYWRQYEQWLDRHGSYEEYINAMVRVFDGAIAGVARRDFLRVAKKVVSRQQDRVYRYTRDLVKDLAARGYFLLAISHSPKYIVEDFAKKLGFHKVYGRILEIDARGCFTGRLLFEELIRDKAKILRRAVEKENLTSLNSVGVGDTESDIGFLKMVTKPVCFNPNQALFAAAKKRHWPVVVERKDVIYKIKK